MRTARAHEKSSTTAAPRVREAFPAALLDDVDLASPAHDPLRHPRAVLRNAFPPHAVRVLRPKVP